MAQIWPTGALPSVSIVVNTYNRGPWLDDALRGLRGLDYPAFEVIVVNGPSTDRSAEVIARWAGEGAIKALDCAEPNLSMSRNIGIGAAAGDIIAFIDDDAVPHPQWLRRLAQAYHDPAVGAVGGFTIDNTGTAWQVRKTLCDRFGDAYMVSDFFDERPLNRPGTPFYPSLLGTNSSFRASALRAIGGFDHAFAYLLDETDVCLRLVDAGWRVVYEPEALVFHQFAASHIRSATRVARTLYPSAVSKGYFITRHGGAVDLARAGQALDGYVAGILESNRRLEAGGQIDAAHRHSLDQDLVQGTIAGQRLAMRMGGRSGGDLAPGTPPPFLPLPAVRGARRIALVSQGWPPANESGIARWTALVARGLAARGHHVHVLTMVSGHDGEAVRFADGLWVHHLQPDAALGAGVAEAYRIPARQAAWAARVLREVRFLRSFGVELVSFPIWDLEALPLVDQPDIATVVSLHTTFGMARPFKPEWIERPLLAARHVAPMIAAETALLRRDLPFLANSHAILDAIAQTHGVALGERAHVVPHGTPDPLPTRAAAVARRQADLADGMPLHVLFVGRFEPRKGFDIALRVARAVLDMPNVEITLAGDALGPAARALAWRLDCGAVLDHPRVHFAGQLAREALDDAYVGADVVLMPSRFESFGLVAIEAMAAGRAVLALDAGGLGEVARPDHGARAFADGPDVVDRIVAEVVWLNTDREELALRQAQARAAYEAHFTIEAMVHGIEEFYTAVLAAREETRDAV